MTEHAIFHSGLLPPAAAYALGVVVALVVLSVLARELRRRTGPLRWASAAVRLAMLALLTLLLAQPNLLVTHRELQPGRTLVLVDDSASMFTKDRVESPAAALQRAADLQLPVVAGRATPWADLAKRLARDRAALDPLWTAARESAATVRTGLPWSDAAQAAVNDASADLKNLEATLQTIAGADRLPPAARRGADAALAILRQEQGLAVRGAAKLDQHGWTALAQQTTEVLAKLDDLADKLAAQQAEADAEFLAADGRQAALFEQLQKLTRYDAAQQAIQQTPALASAAKLNLASGERPVDSLRAVGWTELLDPLARTLTTRPLELLDAVVLLSDGGQNGLGDYAALDVYRQRDVPLVVVGVGAARQAPPLTLIDYRCPSCIPQGGALPVQVEYRVNLPAGTPLELSYALESPPKKSPLRTRRSTLDAGRRGAELPYRATLVADGGGCLQHRALLAVEAEGPQTLRIEAKLPESNVAITQRVPLFVRGAKPSVLLIAERPDKLTERILAQEKYGVRVNPVFTFGQAKNAKRGSSKLGIPKLPTGWGAQDLVILKGGPFPGFTAKDAAAITAQMRKQGTAVWLICDEGDDYLKAFAPLLGWKLDSCRPLAAAETIGPTAEAAHLPPVVLSREVIRNQNLWRQFSGPGRWHGVPDQALTLIRHPHTDLPVMTLGLYDAGKLICMGLGDLERMNQWQTEPFDDFVRATLLDLLVPTGDWRGGAAALGVYPPVAVPGQASLIVVRAPDASAKSASLTIESAAGSSPPQPLAGRDGWFTTRQTFSEAGDYRLHAAGAARPVRCEAQTSAETRDLSLREDVLQQVAAAANGKYVPLAQLEETLAATPRKTRECVDSTVYHTTDYAVPLLIVFLVLAAADFVIRKQLGMVL